GLLDFAELFPQPFGDLVRAQLRFARTFLERVQDDEHAADVGNVRAGEDRVTGDADRMLDTLRPAGDLCHAGDDLVAALQAGAVRELGVDDEVALVLLRDEARGHGPEAQVGQPDEAAVHQQGDHAYTEEQGYRTAVEVRRPVEDPVEAAEEGAQPGVDQR